MCELFMNDLYELLRGRDSGECVDGDCFLLYSLEKLAGELEVDVGLEQDAPHFAEPFLDIGFRECSAAPEAGKSCFKLFAEIFEHKPLKLTELMRFLVVAVKSAV